MNRRGKNPYRWQNPNTAGRGRFEGPSKSYDHRPPPIRGRPPRFPRNEGFNKREGNFHDERRHPRERREQEYIHHREANTDRYRDEKSINRRFSDNSRYDERNFDSFQQRRHRDERRPTNDDIIIRRHVDRSDFFGGKFPTSGRPHRENYFDPVPENITETADTFASEKEKRHFYIEDKYPRNNTQHIESIDYGHQHRQENNAVIRDDFRNNFSGAFRDYNHHTEHFDEELQRKEDENQDRMKNVLLQHLKPVENEPPATEVVNFDEINKILNNPTLKQLLKTVGKENEQETPQSSKSNATFHESITHEDDEAFLYGTPENILPSNVPQKRSPSNASDEIRLYEDLIEKQRKEKSKKRKRDSSRSRSRSSEDSRRRLKKKRSKRRSRSRSRDSPKRRNSESKRRHSSERSKNIEKFLLNAADVAVKNKVNVPIYFNQPPGNIPFPPPNANIVRLPPPVVPIVPHSSPYINIPVQNTMGPATNHKAVTKVRTNRSREERLREKKVSPLNDKRSSRSRQSPRSKLSSSSRSHPSRSKRSPKSSRSSTQSKTSQRKSSSRKTHGSRSSKSSREGSSMSLNEMISNAKHESRKPSSKSDRPVLKVDRGLNLQTNKKGTESPVKDVEIHKSKEKHLKYKPWYDDVCKRIERKRRAKQRVLTKAKSLPKNARQIDIAREDLRKVTRLYTHTLRHAKAEYFKKLEGDTEEFCALVLRDIVDKVCTHERKGTKEEVRIQTLNKKYNLKLPLPTDNIESEATLNELNISEASNQNNRNAENEAKSTKNEVNSVIADLKNDASNTGDIESDADSDDENTDVEENSGDDGDSENNDKSDAIDDNSNFDVNESASHVDNDVNESDSNTGTVGDGEIKSKIQLQNEKSEKMEPDVQETEKPETGKLHDVTPQQVIESKSPIKSESDAIQGTNAEFIKVESDESDQENDDVTDVTPVKTNEFLVGNSSELTEETAIGINPKEVLTLNSDFEKNDPENLSNDNMGHTASLKNPAENPVITIDEEEEVIISSADETEIVDADFFQNDSNKSETSGTVLPASETGGNFINVSESENQELINNIPNNGIIEID